VEALQGALMQTHGTGVLDGWMPRWGMALSRAPLACEREDSRD